MITAFRVGALRSFLEERFAGLLEKLPDHNVLTCDGALSAGGANLRLIELLERAGPFGSGNPAPVFALPAHRVTYADIAGADHVRCTLQASDGAHLSAIAFRAMQTELGELLLTERGRPLHVAGRLSINDWNGKRNPQMIIADAAFVP